MHGLKNAVCRAWALVAVLGQVSCSRTLPNIAPATAANHRDADIVETGRERISINGNWTFSRFATNPDSLSYTVLKNWIMPSANNFLSGTKYQRPSGTAPGSNVSYIQSTFNDSSWEKVNLPHDWAITGPFNAPGITPGGSEGRLPSNGVGWYRNTLSFTSDDLAKTVYLDIDGAMSYSAVWLNGNLVGGWPYGYNSFRLDLTQYIKTGSNQLAVRLDNAVDNSRWYPGAGLYRNVWLVKVNRVHVRQYGTYITTPTVSATSAMVSMMVQVENTGNRSRSIDVKTMVYAIDPTTDSAEGDAVATFQSSTVTVGAGAVQAVNKTVQVTNPKLWGPAPSQTPNMYVAITSLTSANTTIDTYETRFGIRSITYDANSGLSVNGQHIRVQGTCNHHTLGALGSAFNSRAAERQMEILHEMGGNALRTSHNPAAPEFLDIADRLGFLVYTEIFDAWEISKTTNDFSLIFSDWHEPDLRTFIRRDRNHPSVIAWGIGNEVSEQSGASGGTIGQELRTILMLEDATRPSTAAMNVAGGTSALAGVLDLESLNYQGEGLGPSTSSSFPSFHSAQPKKMIWSSETASTLSTRGTYFFPVTSANSATEGDTSGSGGNASALEVSSYDLYATSWGSSPDKVFVMQDKYSYVAGEFVWSGFDYLGETTPYDAARSSYFGIMDLAGFPKDRYYLYQSRWRPDYPVAHILPHWTFPE
ncbi:beta-galactosidase [Xylariaceae sp. FL0255]|nr:beta-galactosidase [Xylariaceae sp. FL0255]